MQQAIDEIKSVTADFVNYPCNTEEDLGLKGFILGALYGLIRAAQLNYADRTGPALPTSYETELNEIAATLARGEAINEDQWLGGFYFNSAMQRLAAGYHRGLQLLTGEALEAHELSEIAVKRRLLTSDDIKWLHTVHGEVHKLHRDRYGLLKGRTINLSDAIKATKQLLALAKRARLRP
jgi:hypothetical protein